MNLIDAIKSLDPENIEHWTSAGLPSVDAVAAMVTDGKATRADISKVAAGYDRDAAKAGGFDFSRAVVVSGVAGPASMDDANDLPKGVKPAPECDETCVSNDPIALIERAVAASKDPRYARNYELQAYLRGWAIARIPIDENQARLDKRTADRENNK